MRNINARLLQEIKQRENSPMELYQIFLKNQTYYFAGHDQSVQFFNELNQPQIYDALGVTRSPIRTDIDSRVDECTLTLNNVTREGTQLLSSMTLINREVRVIKVFQGYLDDPANHIVIFEGVMDAPQMNHETLQLRVKSKLDTLQTQTPRRRYTRLCSWIFGSDECMVDLNSIRASSSIAGIADGKIISLQGRSDPQGYWVNGILQVDIPGDEPEKRIVIASNGAVVEVDFPFEKAALGYPVVIRRGCTRTYGDCVSKYTNGLNYGGFLAVPKRPNDALRKPWAKAVIDESKKEGDGKK